MLNNYVAMYIKLLYIGREKYDNSKYGKEYNMIGMINRIYSYYIHHNQSSFKIIFLLLIKIILENQFSCMEIIC